MHMNILVRVRMCLPLLILVLYIIMHVAIYSETLSYTYNCTIATYIAMYTQLVICGGSMFKLKTNTVHKTSYGYFSSQHLLYV